MSVSCGRVKNAALLAQHGAAKLGLVTHLANNHTVMVMQEGGVAKHVIKRDSIAERPHFRRKKKVKILAIDFAGGKVNCKVSPKGAMKKGTEDYPSLSKPNMLLADAAEGCND